MEQKTIDKNVVKAVAFDFGGTLDSPFMHWMDVYLEVYNGELALGLDREAFRTSYVFAEREMERLNNVSADTSLLQLQRMKTTMQCDDMLSRGVLKSLILPDGKRIADYVAEAVTAASAKYTSAAAVTLARLAERYELILVSNYYGNIRRVVSDMGIAQYFTAITDSTIEGVRKPDPALWRVAIERRGYKPEEVVVVGDSFKNDILPGLELGCQVVHCVAPQKGNDAETTPFVNSIAGLADLLL